MGNAIEISKLKNDLGPSEKLSRGRKGFFAELLRRHRQSNEVVCAIREQICLVESMFNVSDQFRTFLFRLSLIQP